MSKITRKKLTTEEKKEIVKLIKTTDLSDRKIAEKLKEKGIDCHYTTIFRIRKNLPKIEKEIDEEEESKSVVQDDTKSNHLSTKDKDLSPITKDLIRQKDKELERLRRERSNFEDLRSLDKELDDMDKYTIEQLIFKYFRNEQITFLIGTLEGETDGRLAFVKMCSKVVELFETIKLGDLKPKNKEETSNVEELTSILKAKDKIIEDLTTENRAKDKRIEELESETPNKDVLLQQNDKINEELTKKLDETQRELDEKKKEYEELWTNFQRQFQIKTELETKIKDLETKTPFKSSSKSKRTSKTANSRGRQTKLGEVI